MKKYTVGHACGGTIILCDGIAISSSDVAKRLNDSVPFEMVKKRHEYCKHCYYRTSDECPVPNCPFMEVK